MTEPAPPSDDDFPDTWEEAPERPGNDHEPLTPSDPAPAIPSQPPL